MGSYSGDVLLGDAASNELIGFGGSDEIYGFGGDDVLDGDFSGGEDRGHDRLDGGDGFDISRHGEALRNCESAQS